MARRPGSRTPVSAASADGPLTPRLRQLSPTPAATAQPPSLTVVTRPRRGVSLSTVCGQPEPDYRQGITMIVRMTFSANVICATNMSCQVEHRRLRSESAPRPRRTGRATGCGSPRGVVLLLLSPSASPEASLAARAAELDERSLAPHIGCLPFAVGTACRFRSFLRSPEFGRPPLPKDAPIGRRNVKPAGGQAK